MKYLDLNFEGRLVRVASLPKFLGPTLRGAFGLFFKRVVCQISHGQCGKCVLLNRCPYPLIFDGYTTDWHGNAPQPFVLKVEFDRDLEDSNINWTLRLLGKAVDYWPSVLYAFVEICDAGIGRERTPIHLEKITDTSGQILWANNKISVDDVSCGQIGGDWQSSSEPVTLRWIFDTPVCDLVPVNQNKIDGLSLVMFGRRRWNILSKLYDPQVDLGESKTRRFEAIEFQTLDYRLRHWNCSRYSTRKKSRVELWGILGQMTIRGPWFETGPWLNAISTIHLGKSTSFGCGSVRWEIVKHPSEDRPQSPHLNCNQTVFRDS